MKVIEGLKIGNECLNKMHQVCATGSAERSLAWGWAESWVFAGAADLAHAWIFGSFLQVMSIEEVERIIGETQDAVEYQRVRTVCVSSCEQRLPAVQRLVCAMFSALFKR